MGPTSDDRRCALCDGAIIGRDRRARFCSDGCRGRASARARNDRLKAARLAARAGAGCLDCGGPLEPAAARRLAHTRRCPLCRRLHAVRHRRRWKLLARRLGVRLHRSKPERRVRRTERLAEVEFLRIRAEERVRVSRILHGRHGPSPVPPLVSFWRSDDLSDRPRS
jgi:hypothetical protein